MSTKIKRVSRERNLQGYIFYVDGYERCDIRVNSFYNNYVNVEPYRKKFNPETFIKAIIGCLDEESNFFTKLNRIYRESQKEKFIGFNVLIDGVRCLITKKNAAKISKDIPKFYAQNLQLLVRRLDVRTELEFKDKKAEEKWDKQVIEVKEDDGWILKSIFTYARYWAKHMQYLMENTNRRLPQIAAETYSNDYGQDVTEFMKECSEDLLRRYWKYGDELDRWFIGYQENK